MPNPQALTVWIHLLAAVVWIGGMTFLVLVLMPVVRRPELRDSRPELVRLTGARFRWIGWGCLAVLVATGLLRLSQLGFGIQDFLDGSAFRGRFGLVLAHKLALVATILLLSAAHDFWLGPRASGLARSRPDSPEAARARRLAAWIGRANLALALLVTLLGVLLIRGSV